MDIRYHTKSLREERMRLINEAKSVYDDAIRARRAVTKEEQRKVDRLDERIVDLDAEIRQLVDREERETNSAIAREAFDRHYGTGGSDRYESREAEDVRRWFRGETRRHEDFEAGPRNSIAIDLRNAARERELIRQGADAKELRSLLWDTGSIASGVPTSMARSIYGYLEANVAALKMPTTKINTESGENMDFPIIATHGIGTQVIAQGTAIAGTDPVFGKVTLGAYKYGQLIQVSSEVIADTSFDIIEMVARNVGRAVGRVIDTDLVVGTGTSEPQGMMTGINGAGTIATGGSLIDPTYEKLVDLVYSVNDAYRGEGNACWLMRDLTAANLRKLRDGAGGTVGAAMWQPSLTNGLRDGEPDRLLGYRVYTDPNVASLASNARILGFGDFSAYYIRTVGDFVLERSDEFAFDKDLATFRGKWRVDGDYIDTSGAVNLMKRSV